MTCFKSVMAETLGQTVRGLRLKSKIAQQELAQRVGITPAFLSRIENDREHPSRTVLEKIAMQLNIPLVVLNLLSLDLSELPDEKRKALEQSYKELRLLANDLYDLI